MANNKLRTGLENDSKEFALPDYPKTRKIYKLNKEKNGLVEDGEENFYEQIQAHKADTDFETIINQIKSKVLPNAKLNDNPQYGDFTNEPKDFMDLQEKVKNIRKQQQDARMAKEKEKDAKRSNSGTGGEPNQSGNSDNALGGAGNPGNKSAEGKTADTRRQVKPEPQENNKE